MPKGSIKIEGLEGVELTQKPDKNLGGRPPLFETPEELQEAINKYFNEGINKKKIVTGKADNKQVTEIPIPTISGLCYYIGFESRQSFYDYEKKDGFTYTIKRARLFIEQEYEEQLQIGNTIGAIFALKNMGWIDKNEIEHSGEINWVETKNYGPDNKADKGA
jgi:hypothetical protein